MLPTHCLLEWKRDGHAETISFTRQVCSTSISTHATAWKHSAIFWTTASKLERTEDAVHHVRTVFNKFREYLRREYGEPPRYICILEFTQKGIPHLHVLLDRYIPQKWISLVWDRLGGGRVVFIKQVTVRRVAHYLAKYLTKELILSAPKGTRRITTARSIKLFPKFQSGIIWEFLRESIWNVLEKVRASEFGKQLSLFRVLLMHFDEERYLKAFELAETG